MRYKQSKWAQTPVCNGWRRCTDDDTPVRKCKHAEYSISLYVNDEIVKNRCKEVTEWKETVRLAKNIVIEGYASELDEKDEDYIMQVLHERRYI